MGTPIPALPPYYTMPPHTHTDTFRFVHYVAPTVGKRAVGIRLKCLLVFNNPSASKMKGIFSSFGMNAVLSFDISPDNSILMEGREVAEAHGGEESTFCGDRMNFVIYDIFPQT